VDIPRDFINRELKDIDRAHRAVLGRYRSALGQLVSRPPAVPTAARHEVLSGGLSRRRLLSLGSATVLTSAVFGACASNETGVTTPATSTTTTLAGSQTDVSILRTASSIETLAVAVYQKAIDSGLIKTQALQTAAQLFQTQHGQHGDLFQRATSAAGGQPFTDANPVLMQQLVAPRLASLKTESDVVSLAYDLENLAADTYQNNVGTFADRSLNATVMQVGGIEARHVAVLASAINKPVPTEGAFQSVKSAVAPGTGV
jgi:hypothetical protein